MSCSESNQISLYHDGELSTTERAAMDVHLTACGECRQSLAELEALSGLIRQSRRAAPPAESIGRWRACSRNNDRAVLRVAAWLTATAAAILIGVLLTWPAGQSHGLPGAWTTLALTSADVRDDSNPEAEISEWMANDLGDGETYSQ